MQKQLKNGLMVSICAEFKERRKEGVGLQCLILLFNQNVLVFNLYTSCFSLSMLVVSIVYLVVDFQVMCDYLF